LTRRYLEGQNRCVKLATRTFFPVCALLCAVLLPFPSNAECKRAALDLPVTISGTRPLIDAKINGQDVRLLVDSGASFSVISAAMAKQLNLKLGPAPPGLSLRGVGGNIDISVGTAKVLTIANADIPHVEFLVGGSEAGGGSSGILGQNFLLNWNVEYDLAKGLIRMFKDTDCSKQFLAYWALQNPERVTVTNIDRVSLRYPHAIGHAFVNGEKIRVLFDSGAFKSLLSLKAAQRAGLKLDSPDVIDGGETSGIGRNLVKSYIAPFASFKFADGEEIKNARLRVADFDLDLADMLVGADFFLSHRIFIANNQEKVYFTYNGGPVFDLRNTSKPASAGPAGDAPQGAAATAAQSDSKVAQQVPEDASALARRGIASAGRSDYASALADLTRATELAPDNPEYIYQRGQVYRWRKEHEKAAADYGRALQLSPDFVPALMSRAELRIDMRNVPEARTDLEAVDRVAAKQADIRYAMAEDYERADLLPLAIAQFDLWIDSHPEDSRIVLALNGRCKARGVLGQDLPAALKDCNTAVSRSGKQVGAGVVVNRALVRYRLGDYDKATADYDAALKLQPNSAWALYGRGLVKLKKNQRGEGDKDMAEAVKIAPSVVDGYKRMGLSP
jgi:tetratricopeptide (TPR) repeat protein/predicted aspartyl protease